jgi:Family of unknown function (DUF5829)
VNTLGHASVVPTGAFKANGPRGRAIFQTSGDFDTLALMSRALVLTLALSVCTLATNPGQTLPPVYFSHATIFLSKAAYAALLHSSFLQNEFSSFEERTVQREGGTWGYTGIYLVGQHTYLEFFQAGADPHFGPTVPEQIAFNMWIDNRRQLPIFRDRLATENGPSLRIDTTRNGENLPAYDSVTPQSGRASDFGPGMRVEAYVKGYYPDGLTRQEQLAGRFRPNRLLRDVTGFTLTVNRAERTRLAQEFRAYGYQIRIDGEKQIAAGPEVRFTLIPAKANAPRSLRIDLSLNRPSAAEQAYRLDEAGELRIRSSAAGWTLESPAE